MSRQRLGAGYVNALLSISWTVLALCSASLRDHQVRRANMLGPLLMLGGVVGLMVVLSGRLV